MPHWFYKYKLYHIPFWIIYHYTWWTVAIGNPVKSFTTIFASYFFVKFLFYYSWQTAAVYFNLYYLFPRYFEKGRYNTYVGALVGTTIIASACILPGYYITANIAGTTVQQLFQMQHSTSFLSIYLANCLPSTIACMTLAMSIKLGRSWLQTQRREQVLEKEKLETELNFLKYQFNPHFLFNTINSIFFLIHQHPDRASASLAKFSDLLRHQLYECNDKQILLSKEIAYLENGIELERLRQNEGVNLDIQLPGNYDPALGIAPFILMTFVENAFRNAPAWVQVHLQIDGRALKLVVANSIHADSSDELSLRHVKRRLDLMYPGQYDLTLRTNSDRFTINLTLQLSILQGISIMHKIA
jgi:LytS/YehU family sensor histidine kinase